MADNTVNIKVVLDESGVKQGIASIKSDVKGLADDASRASSGAADGLGKVEEAAEDAAKGLEGAGESGKGLGEKTKQGTRDAEKAVRDFKSQTASAVKDVGDGLTKSVTVPLAAAGAASLKAAVDIDTSLTNVRKTVDGTEEDYQRLKDAAVEFSKTNAVEATQLLDIEALGAQLGYTLDTMENGKTEVQEFGEVVAGLDIATNMSAEQAGSELAQFANIMGMAKDETSNYGSTIVALGNSFATTESDISAMSMRIAGAGKNIGLSEADVLGLATALSSLGIEAEAGGTAISTVMSEVDKSVALQDENLRTWADTAHMSVDDFTAAWKGDAVGALDAVFKGMAQNVDEGGNLAVMLEELGISSIRQTDMMKRLANSGDLMKDAVAAANTAWEENSALTKEVENRNGSLEAKFQMLKNRVTAVAMEVGEPLADALMDAIDAAEPLFQAIESGAKAFAEMDEGQQRAIISALGLAAAVGPMLSLFGRAGMSALDFGDKLLGIAQASEKVGGAAGTVGKLAGALGKLGPVAAGIGIALGIGTAFAVEFEQAREKAETFKTATDDLGEAVRSLGTDAEASVPGVSSLQSAMEGSARSADEAARSQADLARSISESFSDTNADAALLQYYGDKIKELSGHCGGSAEKMAELQAAVEGYNEIAGTSYSVIDETTGIVDASTQALEDNTEAWIQNARAQAAQEALKDVEKERIQLQLDMASAEERLNEARAARDADPGSMMRNQELNEASYAYADLTTQMESLDDAASYLTGQIAECNTKAKEASSAASEWSFASEAAVASLDANGQSVQGLAAALESVGISAESAKGMASESFDALAASFDGTTLSIVAKAQELGIQLPAISQAAGPVAAALQDMGQKAADALASTGSDVQAVSEQFAAVGVGAQDMSTVTGAAFASMWQACDGDVTAMAGKIAEWNSLEAEGKQPKVDAKGNVIDGTAKKKVEDYNKTGIESKDTTVKAEVEGNVISGDAQEKTADAKKSVDELHDKSVDVSAYVNGKNDVDQLGSSIRNLPSSKTVSITTNRTTVEKTVKKAAGGFYGAVPAHAAGGLGFAVPRFAGGAALNGIVSRATMTTAGLVGEAGREVVMQTGPRSSTIVPIENPRYMAPFADAVADAMGDRLAGGPSYHIGNITVEAGSRLADDIDRLVDDLQFEIGMG